MKKPMFQLGDLIVRTLSTNTIAITVGTPYEVVEVDRDRRVFVIDDNGRRYPISREFFYDRWVLFGSTNEEMVHLLKEG